MNWVPQNPREWIEFLGAACGIFAPIIAGMVARARVERKRMHEENQSRLAEIERSIGGLDTRVALQNGRVTRLEDRIGDVEENVRWLERRAGGA